METTNPAFEDLESLASSNGWVLGLARRLVGDAHLAEDLAQEAYLRALSTPDKARQHSKGWFAGVIRNLSRSSARESGRRRDREERRAKHEVLDFDADPTASNVARLEQQTLLIQALLSLNEAYRGAILMRHVDGLPPREIAAQLGVSVATVNSRLTRGLEQLRDKLSSAHGGDRQRWLAAFAPLLQPAVSVTGSALPLTFGTLLMNYKITAALAVLAISFSGWWLASQPALPWLVGGSGSADSNQVATLAQSASESEQDTSGLTASDQLGDPRRTAASVQNSLSSEQEQASGTPGLIRVNNGQNGERLAGAKVYLVDWQQLSEAATLQEQAGLRSEMPNSMRKVIRKRAIAYTTDQQGQAQVPIPEDGVELFAEHGQLFGNAMVHAGSGPHSIDLHSDRPLQVRVVDSQGHALVDIPVMLAARMGERLLPISTGFTRKAGLTKAALAELAWVPTYGEPLLNAASDGLVVSLRFPGAGTVTQEVDLEHWPTEVITLESPPLGGVLIRTVPADTETKKQKGLPTSIVHLASNESGLGQPYLSDPSLLAGTTRKGEVLFTPVGLGLNLVAAGWFHSSKTPELLEFKGPRFPNQVVEVDLTVNSTPLLLVGSLFHADGQALKESFFSITFDGQAGNEHSPLYAETDVQGHFEIEWASDPDRPLQGTYRLQTGGPDSLSLSGDVPQVNTGKMDLGRLLLPRSAHAGSSTSGVVLTPDGAPLVSAHVHWVIALDNPEAAQPIWQSKGAPAITGTDGRFLFAQGQTEAGAHLRVSPKDSFYHQPVPVTTPSQNLTLQMQAGTNLSGRLLLEDDLPAERISVSLWNHAQGPAPGRSDVWGWKHALVRDQAFRLEGLAPGTYTLRAAAPADPEPFVLENFHVAGAEELRPAQLNPIDLTGRYRSFRIRSVDEVGRNVRAAVYTFEKAWKDGAQQVSGPRYLGHNDRGHFLSVIRREHAFVLSADGFFAVSLDPEQLPRKVVLERGQQVELLWASESSLAELPFALKLQLAPELPQEVFGGHKVESYLSRWSPSTVRMESPSLANEEGRAQTLANHVNVRQPGVYRLVWETDYEFTEGYHLNRIVELAEQTTITVTSDSKQSFRVSLSDEVIANETAWLRARFEELQTAGNLPSDLPFGEKYTPGD